MYGLCIHRFKDGFKSSNVTSTSFRENGIIDCPGSEFTLGSLAFAFEEAVAGDTKEADIYSAQITGQSSS